MGEASDIAPFITQELWGFLPVWALGASLIVAFVAGFVKGAVGFAMPLIILSGLTLYLEPVLAIAGLIVPTVVSNVVQSFRHGWAKAWAVVVEFRRYIGVVCVMIIISAQFVTRVPAEVYYLVLGIPVTILSLVQLMGVTFNIPENRRLHADFSIGLVAGALGGFSGTWGPPTALYLIALGTEKAKLMLAQGVVYGLGSITLVLGHVQSGVVTWTTLQFSATLLLPALAGQALGLRMSDRLDPEVFRRMTLAVILLAGLNLIRRGLF